jgi:hypothetical protein
MRDAAAGVLGSCSTLLSWTLLSWTLLSWPGSVFALVLNGPQANDAEHADHGLMLLNTSRSKLFPKTSHL